MPGTTSKPSWKYWTLVSLLMGIVAVGVGCWIREHQLGSGPTTGLSQDVPWGLHIGQLTFFVGIAASAVIVLLPFYLHNVRQFARITVLGEFLAVGAVVIAMLSVFTIMGKPGRVLNVLVYPTPRSIIFWDFVVLSVYLGLNLLCGCTVLLSERKRVPAPGWVKPFIYLSIFWAPSIHVVTAFLYSGLPGKDHWMTALQAVHFLATAFAAGPALLIVLTLLIQRVSRFDAGAVAIQTLAKIATYALILHLAFVGLELFTALYSQVPGHLRTLRYLYVGLEGHRTLVPVMWTSSLLAVLGLVLLANPRTRQRPSTLTAAAMAVFLSIWLDKGFAFVVAGSIPNAFDRVTEYWPRWNELGVAAGVMAVGALVLTVLYRMAVGVKEQVVVDEYGEKQVRDPEPALEGAASR
jgi:Ni/Fe-hydrogenase subunit HybB-like protein